MRRKRNSGTGGLASELWTQFRDVVGSPGMTVFTEFVFMLLLMILVGRLATMLTHGYH